MTASLRRLLALFGAAFTHADLDTAAVELDPLPAGVHPVTAARDRANAAFHVAQRADDAYQQAVATAQGAATVKSAHAAQALAEAQGRAEAARLATLHYLAANAEFERIREEHRAARRTRRHSSHALAAPGGP